MDSLTSTPSPHHSNVTACPSAGGGVAASLSALCLPALLVIPDDAAPSALGGHPTSRDHAAMAAVLYARGSRLRAISTNRSTRY